jgi:penicillin-binding protein 1A
MTYAHQNIDLLPIPFIDNPFPVAPAQPVAEAAGGDQAPLPQAPRPKLLSKAAQQMLIELERKLREAKPVSANQVVAADREAAPVSR